MARTASIRMVARRQRAQRSGGCDGEICVDPTFRQPPADPDSEEYDDRIGQTFEALNTGKPDAIADTFAQHSSGQRTNTDTVIAEKLRATYKHLALTVVPTTSVNLLAYASAGHAEAVLQEDEKSALGLTHSWHSYVPAGKRIDGDPGFISEQLFFGKFLYRWAPTNGQENLEFIVYVVNGRDGGNYYPSVTNHYILSEPSKKHILDELLISCGLWLQELRGEIWVFDSGYWQKSAELWNSVKKATWENVILAEEMKQDIRDDVEGFFKARESYTELNVPWKRGIIFYGPPGNGKTISIKAMMNTLYNQKPIPIPTLYVRSLKSINGGEYSIREIFKHARQQAPCYLIFEDLDSLVTDELRSYFLNEVDGLNSNNGILMLGSTNHLDRLDPGIAKRPSRFDRKYLFSNPDTKQREAYCRFWQKKLEPNKDVEFPDSLCGAIAAITDGFSFAYIQEAFVASLLTIARQRKSEGGGDGEHDPLDQYILWRQIKKQIQALREGLKEEAEEEKKKDEEKEEKKEEKEGMKEVKAQVIA